MPAIILEYKAQLRCTQRTNASKPTILLTIAGLDCLRLDLKSESQIKKKDQNCIGIIVKYSGNDLGYPIRELHIVLCFNQLA